MFQESDEVITFAYLCSKPKVGDVIIFRQLFPPFVFCKRIIKIVKEKIWVEGDNKSESIDSRDFGYIKSSDIVGKVIFKL